MFNSADTLSIRFLLDLYDQYSHMARITGTIGLTSDLDPLEVTGGRLLQPTNPNLGPASMYYDKTAEKLYLDVCMSFEGEVDGNFDIPGDVHVGVLETNCVESIENCITPLLNGGPLPLAEGAWYNVFGGVVSVTLVEAEPDVSMSRIVLYAEDKAGKRTIIAMEPEHGIQIGLTTNLAIRLNVGETSTYGAFVTSFGEPVVGATMEIGVIAADSSTDCNRATCFNELSVPLDAISMTIPMSTDTNGRTSVDVTAVKNPGNPRGCGLDGQLYVVRLFYKYLDPIEPTNLKKAVCYFNPSATAGDPKKAECENDGSKIVNIGTLQPIIKVYDEVEVKDKPTWFDVRDIFIQYYNLYPVMWKNGIIDLHSYKDIKKNKAMLEYAMFELNISDPRHMPVTRDLSASRKKLIKNWMDNGMPYSYPGDPTGDTLFSCAAETIPVKITELQRLGQAAIITELTTIPPYVTAWLSLQTEFGRNVEVAGIIKSVFVEEMLHMSLAANLINSVGGVVNLTSMALLPQYPTPLGSGTFFDLMPGVYVSIEPLSLGLARDLFAKIETPATEQEQKIFHSMAEMWKLLSTQTGRDTPTSKNMRLLLNDYQKVRFKRKSPLKKAMNQNLTSDIVWDLIYDFSVKSLKELSNKPTNTIGAFYLRVALFAAMVESCAQKNALANPSANQSPTIFTGDVSKQVDMNQWNNPEDQPDITNPAEPSLNSEGSGSIPISSLYQPLFPVTDLQKAIEAIIEIVYQGEGGSQCTPFVGEKTQDNPTPEISHYYRFLEIANQKKIVKMKVPVEYTAGLTCMNLTGHDCHNDLELGENYCFGGPAIPFREDGVWPLVHNPQNGMYVKNTKAWKLNKEFNNAYTTLLKCLEKGFGTGSM
uniref:uncharacterized protein LOC108950240 n=1 Tax=Ciona intestinalis TaxID=7719 RepID=UPI00089DBF6A|nr:uncharacterized protein LOC108950240 [Ciona intestinalis]|eukprot:XP_018670947.1 uncharacterized protein LOC108950240 [Ciona intestinalis]